MRNVVVLALAALVLAGCGTDSPTPTPPATTPANTLVDTTTAAPVPGDSKPESAEASSGAALTVTDIRIGKHPGFDRVVYDLGGKGTPGWDVRYVDRAIRDASGFPVDIPGGSILEVRILGVGYPFDTNEIPYAGPDPKTDPSVPGITGVYNPLVFEGIAQSFIGLQATRPNFTVSALTNPTRLVVDIATT